MDNSYRFNISISEKGYASKEEAEKALPYYLDKKNKIENRDVCYFSKVNVNVEELAAYIASGHTMCGVFDAPQKFIATFKTSDRFAYTHALFFDIDDAACTMHELLNSVPYKPTIAYRTFSDGLKGNRYRFVYVLEDYVNAKNHDYVYDRIAEQCNLPQELDKRGCTQCYFRD